MKIKRAIISVSNKAGLSELAPFLKSYGVEILSTGGTKRYLDSIGVNPVEISAYTGFPEIMDGRVKTLHPKVHGGILNIRDNAEHQKAMEKQGFKDKEISRQPTRTIDKLASEYSQNQAGDRFRYVVTSSVKVTTTNIDLVTKALGVTEELLKSGVLLDGQQGEGMANPRYVVTTFNDLRPQLLAEATKNARLTASQFASDSGATVGRICSANQGMIQIFGSDGNDESAPYSPTSTPVKKIRVVSTFAFELK